MQGCGSSHDGLAPHFSPTPKMPDRFAVDRTRTWPDQRWAAVTAQDAYTSVSVRAGALPSDHKIVSVMFSLRSKGGHNAKDKQYVDYGKNLQT